MSDNLCSRVRMALASAESKADYRAAKSLAAGLSIEQQFTIVDDLIACARRLREVGVL